MATDDPKIITEACGCRRNVVTGVYVALCEPCLTKTVDNPTTEDEP